MECQLTDRLNLGKMIGTLTPALVHIAHEFRNHGCDLGIPINRIESEKPTDEEDKDLQKSATSVHLTHDSFREIA